MPGTPPLGCLRMESLDCGRRQSQGWAHTCIGGLSMELQMRKLHLLSFASKNIWVPLASFASLFSALDGLRLTLSVCASLRIATSLPFLVPHFAEVSITSPQIPLSVRQMLPFHAFQPRVRLHCLPAFIAPATPALTLPHGSVRSILKLNGMIYWRALVS